MQRENCFDDLQKISNRFVYVSKDEFKAELEIKYFFPNLQNEFNDRTNIDEVFSSLSATVFPVLIDSILAAQNLPNQNTIQILCKELRLRNNTKPLIHEP